MNDKPEIQYMRVQSGAIVRCTPDRERGTAYDGLNKFARSVGKEEALAWHQRQIDKMRAKK